MQEDFVGMVAHLCWCAYQMGAGQEFNEWPTEAQSASQRRAARGFLRNPDMTAEENHEMWMADRVGHGWKWGPVKDETKREHPDLVPYGELPEVERLKDEMDLMSRRHAAHLWATFFRRQGWPV